MLRSFSYFCLLSGTHTQPHTDATFSDSLVLDLSAVDSETWIETAFSYMSTDEIQSMQPLLATLSELNRDFHDISSWRDLLLDPSSQPIWDSIYLSAETKCKSLNLSSTDCYDDCLHYNSVSNWIPLIASNHSEDEQLLYQMATLYSVSSSSLRWFDVGNPDQCLFFGGTYCATPAVGKTRDYVVMQHGCCVPGTCSGEDAERVLRGNTRCFEQYQTIYSAVDTICEPMEREMDRFTPWITIIIFLFFLCCIVIASILRQIRVDGNWFISTFNIRGLLRTFGRTRPKDKSSLNFLDGIRVWSMTWVKCSVCALLCFVNG